MCFFVWLWKLEVPTTYELEAVASLLFLSFMNWRISLLPLVSGVELDLTPELLVGTIDYKFSMFIVLLCLIIYFDTYTKHLCQCKPKIP